MQKTSAMSELRCPLCGKMLGRGAGSVDLFEIKCRGCKALVLFQGTIRAASVTAFLMEERRTNLSIVR